MRNAPSPVSVLTDDEHGPSDFAVILAPGQPARTLSLATRVGLQLASASNHANTLDNHDELNDLHEEDE